MNSSDTLTYEECWASYTTTFLHVSEKIRVRGHCLIHPMKSIYKK